MSVEDWGRLPEDQAGELVGGILVEEEVPSYLHEATLVWMMGVLLAWCREHGARLAGAGLKYRLSEQTGRVPDLSVFLAGLPRPPARGLVPTPPSIVVEVVSASPADARRDRIEKLSEYAAFGVEWYWLVDPELRSFEILELNDDGKYVHVVNATAGAVELVPGCEGLRLDVDDLWRELDEVLAEGGSEGDGTSED